jgi:hypothetical protein
MSWHVDGPLLTEYLDGRLPEAPAASVESHVMGCAACREQLARADAAPSHEATWHRLADAVDDAPVSRLEAALEAVLPSWVVRLIAAAPSLRRSWWAAGIGLLGFALLASHLGTGVMGTALFVVAAPLLPLAGVALAYAAGDDLVGEVARTTPYPRFRVLLLRTGAVTATTLPVAALLALALPVGVRPATLWLAPALALCALALAFAARFDTRRVAAVLTALWLAGSFSSLKQTRAAMPIDELLERSFVFRPAGQAVLFAVAALAFTVAVLRRNTYENRSRA